MNPDTPMGLRLSGHPGWRPAGATDDGTPETPGQLPPELADDPAPTTGGPVDAWWEDRPDGCLCYVREDPEYGEVWTRPPAGCPVHSCTCLACALGDDHSAACLHTILNAARAAAEAGASCTP